MDGLNVVRFPYFWPSRWQKLAYGGMLPNLKRNPLLWAQVPFFLAAELISAWWIVWRQRPDVIHAHWIVPQGLVAAMLRLITGKPVVMTAHGGDVYGAQGGIKNRLKRWALGHSSALTAVSRDLASALEALAGSGVPGVEVISMGVDADRFSRTQAQPELKGQLGIAGPMLLFVGRLAEKKGVRYLLDAMPTVLKQYPDACLLVIGDGPLRADLEAQARSLTLGDAVRFLGAKRPDELPAFYGAADVFVGPSIVAEDGDVEGLPVSIMEAMASGCPVVATDVGGISELVVNGETGLLVAQADSRAIAGAVLSSLGDASLTCRITERGRACIRERFNQPVIADRYAEVILKVAA
jgi:glycosyltransferase involved in cell wall biosynthesis